MRVSGEREYAVPPLALAEVYGVDGFRYFLLRDMILGQDADFAEERLAARYGKNASFDGSINGEHYLVRLTLPTDRKAS